MDAMKKRAGLGVVAGVLGTLVVLAVICLIVVYTGAFNIAATEEHQSITRWAFDTTFHNSVELRAADVVAPEKISPAMVTAGASAYKSMCQHCHAGPGAEREDCEHGIPAYEVIDNRGKRSVAAADDHHRRSCNGGFHYRLHHFGIVDDVSVDQLQSRRRELVASFNEGGLAMPAPRVDHQHRSFRQRIGHVRSMRRRGFLSVMQVG